MSQYLTLFIVLLVIIVGCAVDLVMALKCYLVVEGIKGGEGIRLWFRQRSGLLMVVGILYLLLAGGMIFLEMIPAGALHPQNNGFMGNVFILLDLLAPYRSAFIVLLLLLAGFVVDLILAVKSYQGMDDLHGRDALLSWFRQRSGLMIMTGGLYLLFFVVVYTDLLYLAGLRQDGVQVARSLIAILTGMNPILSALGVLLLVAGGFALDLFLALHSYRGLDNLHGGEARQSWFRQRRGRLASAAGLYLLFVILFFSDLFHLSTFRQQFVSLVKGAISFLAVVGPYKSAVYLLLLILAGAMADLYVALRASKGLDNLQRGEAIREWFQLRTWRLAGMGLFFLAYVGLVVFTDLIRLPGIKYENKEYVDNADSFLKRVQYREAVLELRNALQKSPEDRLARLKLARTLLLLKEYSAAEVEFRAVDAVDKTSYYTRFGLARVMLATGRRNEALTEIKEAIRRRPEAVEPHLLLAQVYRRDGLYLQSLQECRTALVVKPDHRQAREEFISTALAGRFFGEALREVETGLRSNPDDLRLRFDQATALGGLGRLAEAEGVLKKAAELNPTLADPWFVLAQYRLRSRDLPGAIRCLEEGVKRDGKNLPAMNNLAQLLADEGRDLRRAHELAAYVNWAQPQNGAYADTLGWILVKKGKCYDALPYLRVAVTKLPKRAEIRYHLGMALMGSGNPSAGRKELDAALRLAGDFEGANRVKALLVSTPVVRSR